MGMLDKLKSKLEETKSELGLSSRPSSSAQHQQYQQQPAYPGQQQQQYPPPGQGYYHQPPYQQQQGFGQPSPGPPEQGYHGPPPPIPGRPAGFETASPAIPPRPEEPEDETTPPPSPHPELAKFRPVSPFPESSPEEDGGDDDDDVERDEPELTEEEIWAGIPEDQIVYGPGGRKDPLGGQVTGHERHRHCDPLGEDSAASKKVLGLYYPEWRVYLNRPPSAMRQDLATHIYYAFAVPQSNGYLAYMDYWAAAKKECDDTNGCLNATGKLRMKHPNLKLILSCGGETGSKNFKHIAARSWKRIRFAKSVRYWLMKYRLNGVDIDWEFPDTPHNGANYVRLLRTLRAYLPRPYYQITTALPAGEWVLRNIDIKTASFYLDYLNLMCYDLAGPWSDKSGHQAALHQPRWNHSAPSGDSAVNYLIRNGFPRWKIVIGVPVYAQYFPGARGPGDAFNKPEASQMEYRDVSYWKRKYAQVDTTVVAASNVDSQKGFMSFDTPETVQIKAHYVKSQGLGGLFYWHGVGDVWGSLGLVCAGHKALNG
ncbi:hypothetical protein MKZ38_000300 [Zalerion maritima]|uniref:chitinase n=1 Tax=Zalerion maritima TaxID=339359 RepID=A0AAD5WSL9_9PEZI|nr:hypothetical protein MKZ38_000300 [Zalerion maritima]